jgi:hypothetical protein
MPFYIKRDKQVQKKPNLLPQHQFKALFNLNVLKAQNNKNNNKTNTLNYNFLRRSVGDTWDRISNQGTYKAEIINTYKY